MLIPYSTDAPIYHYPIATVTFIVINVFCFFLFCVGLSDSESIDHFLDKNGNKLDKFEVMEQAEELQANGEDVRAFFQQLRPIFGGGSDWRSELLLHYGRGLRPWQWLTCIFMHADIMHLIGNMIFLWSFGLLLEGKLGWWLFSIVYLGMGVFQSFAEQTLFFFQSGASLGASGAIFSLLALVAIFAPLNSFETFLFFGFRVFLIEVPILVFCAIYLFMNGLFFALSGGSYGTEALHLIGFLVGVPVGFHLLTKGYVDCEGFDIISHYTNKTGKDSKVGKKKLREREKKREALEMASLPRIDQGQVRAKMADQVDQAILEGNCDLAVALQAKIAMSNPGAGWTQKQLIAIIQHFMKEKQLTKAEPLIEKHIELFDLHRFALQTKLIKLWLHDQRPRHALRYMQGMNPAFLEEAEKTELNHLAAYARKLIQTGVLET
ncbi:MAG: rhomboid family intramembrane serine protease [Planctomycetota bacterium]|nr:rhomboid family intramembrane serine protease [Planctomycetota bacterium]